jgi:hypothetical protein
LHYKQNTTLIIPNIKESFFPIKIGIDPKGAPLRST